MEMRHTNLDLRRLASRKLAALGARRRRLLNQQVRVVRALEQVDRLTRPVMDLLAEIDAQATAEQSEPAATPAPLVVKFPTLPAPRTSPRSDLWK